tara:strand:- start:463 stop:771 length:309 start_codon:yes stop_codon:yes gene_type:complete
MNEPISLHGWTVETETIVDEVGLQFYHAWVEISLKEGGPLRPFGASSIDSPEETLRRLSSRLGAVVRVMIYLNGPWDKEYKKVHELSMEIDKRANYPLSTSA